MGIEKINHQAFKVKSESQVHFHPKVPRVKRIETASCGFLQKEVFLEQKPPEQITYFYRKGLICGRRFSLHEAIETN